jgi:hypothetical protein
MAQGVTIFPDQVKYGYGFWAQGVIFSRSRDAFGFKGIRGNDFFQIIREEKDSKVP